MPPEDQEKRDSEHRKDAAEIAVAKIQRELANTNIIESTARIHQRAGGEREH